MLDHPKASSVRGVVPSKQNPYKMWTIDPDGMMNPLLDNDYPEPYNMPRQELPPTYWQTGHIDVVRTGTIVQGSMSGENIYACQIDPIYSIDLDNDNDWEQAESHISTLADKIVLPGYSRKSLPKKVSLLVLDFDGVITDDRVYLNQNGEETIAAHRGDGMGIAQLRNADVEVIILSKEKNPVVQARADKLGIQAYSGIDDKDKELKAILKKRKIAADEVVYLGNDVNDLPCFPLVGLAAAVADAHPDVIKHAGLITKKKGGFGAVREICELIIANI
jgi:N-acylneuraminate cytidylyltransferase